MSISAAFLSNLSALKDQRVLVTGGAGFIGRNLVDLLIQCQCKEIIVFDVVKPNPPFVSPSVTPVIGDLLRPADLEPLFSSLYAVFHVAAPPATANNPALFHSVNVDGTRNVIAACAAGNIPRLVYTSSASVVFDGSDQKNLDEAAPVPKRRLDAYTTSKYRAERLVLAASSPSLFTCAIRPHGVFGPRDAYLLPNLHRTAVNGKNKYQVGDGSNLVDFTFVSNVVYAHVLACTQLGPRSPVNGQAYFITNRQPVLFWDFFARLYNELGYPGPTIPLPVAVMRPVATALGALKSIIPAVSVPVSFSVQAVNYTGSYHYYSCEKAVKDFGYVPPVPLEDGILRSVAAAPELQRKDGNRWTEPEYTAAMDRTWQLVLALVLLVSVLMLFHSGLLSWVSTLSLWSRFLIGLHVVIIGRFLLHHTAIGEPGVLLKEKHDLTGITVVITGANKGIGYESALQLARMHATVILACRDEVRGSAAVERIQRVTNNPNVSCQHLDLNSFASVKRFAAGLKQGAMRIDVLVHNAGAMIEKGTTVDGNDSQLQANYLSSFLLTHLLLRDDVLAPSARIVLVSSLMHSLGHIDLSDLNCTRRYNRLAGYNTTKLMQIAFAFRLQHHLDQQLYDNIAAAAASDALLSPSSSSAASPSPSSLLCRRTAVAVDPGGVNSEFHYHFLPKVLMRPIQVVLQLIGVTKHLRYAVSTVVYACVSRELLGVGGVYVQNCHCAVASREARSRKVQDALWDRSMEMISKHMQ